MTYWGKRNPKSVGDLTAQHRRHLTTDAAPLRTIIARAYLDTLGRNPTGAEIKYRSTGNDRYFQLMKNHVAFRTQSPAE